MNQESHQENLLVLEVLMFQRITLPTMMFSMCQLAC